MRTLQHLLAAATIQRVAIGNLVNLRRQADSPCRFLVLPEPCKWECMHACCQGQAPMASSVLPVWSAAHHHSDGPPVPRPATVATLGRVHRSKQRLVVPDTPPSAAARRFGSVWLCNEALLVCHRSIGMHEQAQHLLMATVASCIRVGAPAVCSQACC